MTLSLRLPVYAVAGTPTPAHTHSLKKKKASDYRQGIVVRGL